nr:hypothetical protein [Francisella tularensis]
MKNKHVNLLQIIFIKLEKALKIVKKLKILSKNMPVGKRLEK